jgi:hypothetical protein
VAISDVERQDGHLMLNVETADGMTRAAAAVDGDSAVVVASTGLKPSPVVTDFVWRVVVMVFAAAFLGAVATLLIGRFLPVSALPGAVTSTDTLVTVLTTCSAFLAGLLVPSPIRTNGDGGR